jgi:hypothetical protein
MASSQLDLFEVARESKAGAETRRASPSQILPVGLSGVAGTVKAAWAAGTAPALGSRPCAHFRVAVCPACGFETRDIVFGSGKSAHECRACGSCFQVVDAPRPRGGVES